MNYFPCYEKLWVMWRIILFPVRGVLKTDDIWLKISTDFEKMLAFFQRILDWFKSLFWKEEMELTLVGLQYSGKTTFVNVIAVSSPQKK